ncbi:MAG TPA: SDR family oxidoreductase [Rhodoglobus sp.]|nr:SDR family oxidoreductase [Rhodoglobus sp.]
MPLALVTGAARDNSIAVGVVLLLREQGWDVATNDFDGTVDYDADLADPAAPAALVTAVRRDRGPITALILSHALDVETGVLDTSADAFDRHMAVNARASLMLIAAFAQQVPETGGAIVALTSDATTGNLPYGASKGALDRIVISAARELAPSGISANVVNPGPVDTGWMTDDVRATLTADQPAGRLGTPADAARLVGFLASPEGRWVSGQLIHSDGAYSARY